jgi:ABC-type glycerol-3-phosphate transport system substrate-binding protein
MFRIHRRVSCLMLIVLMLLLAACDSGATPTVTAPSGGAAPTDTAASAAQPTAGATDTTSASTGTTPAATTGTTGSGSAVKVTVLSNFTSDVARGKVLNALIAQFNQSHVGQIEVVSSPDPDWPTLQQKIKSMIAAHSAPDVFLYNYNPSDLTREQSGELMDWSSYLNADPAWKASFRPENLQGVTVNGQIVAIPSDQAPVLFYYHKDLFTKAGIQTFPTTWTEFFQDADKLKASGVAPIALMTADDAWHTMNAFTYLTTATGGVNVFDPAQPLNSSAVVTGATQLKKLFGYTTSDAIGANYSISSNNFLTGKAAMVIDGPWMISSIQAKTGSPGDVAVAAAPTNGDGKVPPGYIVTDSLNLWGAAKQSDKAKEQAVVAWMKFLTSADSARKLSVEGQYPLAVKTTLTPADITAAGPLMGQVLQLNTAAPATVVEVVRNIKTAAQAQLPSLLESLALGQTAPQDFANQLQNFNK